MIQSPCSITFTPAGGTPFTLASGDDCPPCRPSRHPPGSTSWMVWNGQRDISGRWREFQCRSRLRQRRRKTNRMRHS